MASHDYHQIVHRLAELEPPKGNTPDTIRRVKLSDEGQRHRKALAQFARDVAEKSDLPVHLRNAASKFEGLHAWLTLIFRCILLAEKEEEVPNDQKALVGAEPARLAAEFIYKVVYPHAYRFYAEVLGVTSPAMELAHWISDHILARADAYQAECEISFRDVYRARSETASTVDRRLFDEAMTILVDLDWLVPTGKPNQWNINPRIWSTFTQRAADEASRRRQIRESIEAKVRAEK